MPTDVSGMQLWFDANDPTCYTLSSVYPGTIITQLNDKSGNGNNTTSIKNVSGGVPIIQGNAINQLPVFNLYNCGFLGNLSAGSQNTGTTTSFCMVVIFTNLSSVYPRVLSLGNNDGTNDSVTTQKMCLTVGYTPISLWRNNVATTTPVTMSINTPYLVTGYFDGTNEYLGVNGVYNYVATSGTFNIINYGIGVNTYNNTEIGTCKYGEIIVYKSALSTLNMQRMEGYLASKWGLNSSLPINHPFRYSSVAYNTPIPPNISGLQLWFDASNPTSYGLSSGSSNILSLNDKSPNVNTTNTYYGTQPTFQTNIINTLPVFNMENGAFSGSFYSPNRGNSLSFCMIVTITSYTGPISNAPIIFSLGNLGTNIGTVPLVIQDQKLQLQLYSGNVVNPVTISLNTPYLVTCYINGTTQYLGVNAVYASTSNTIPNENIYSYGIGYNIDDSGEIGNCKYGEVLVFNNQLSTVSLQQLEGYLAWKWGTNTLLPNTHPYYIYAPALIIGTSSTSNFVPTYIPGVQLWLDALDYSTLNFDIINNVSQWNDKSGYSRNANYYGNTTITGGSIKLNVGYKPFGFNNLPAITYDFSTKQGLKSLMPAGTLSAGCTLFVVFKSSSLSNSTLLCRDVGGPIGGPFMIYGGYRYINGLNGNSSYNIGTTSTASTIYSCTITNTSIWNDYINGTISFSQYIASTYNDTSTYVGIGLRSDYATWFQGSISEILVYNQALPAQSRQLIEGYLAWKWNLASSLPSSHPYKLGMPSDIPYSGIITPIPTWLQYYSTANKLLQSYMNGFLDISGNLIVRGYPTTMLGGDLITNGNVYMNGGNLITGGNINVSNIFGLSSGITTNMLTVNSDVSLSNIVTSSFTNLSNLTISGNLILMNGLTNTSVGTTPSFSPLNFSGMQLWVDANDPATYTLSGSNITQLKDKSGLANNSTAYYGTQPTFQTNIINGLPVFNMVNGAFGGNFSSPNNGTSITIFMIVIATSYTGPVTISPRILGLGTYGTQTGSLPLVLDNQPYPGVYPNSGSVISKVSMVLNTPYLITCYINGTNIYLGVNGVYNSSSYSGNLNISRYGIGCNTNDNAEIAKNKYGEVLVYNTALSTANIQQMEGYLAWKWGTNTSLPTGHPYYGGTPYLSQPSSTVFSPFNVSGMTVWVDASDPNSYTLSGSNITQLKDKSGNGNNTTGYNGAQPTFLTNAINGLPVFNIAGGSGFYGNMSNTGTTMTFFCIAILTNTATTSRLIDFTDGLTTDDGQSVAKAVVTMPTIALYRANGTGGGSVNSGIGSQNIPYLVTCYFNGTNGYLAINGTYSTPFAVSGNFSITKYGIGATFNSYSNQGYAKYGEVLIYNTSLSTLDRQKTEGYLAWKWGLNTSLPTNHPYYSAAPTNSSSGSVVLKTTTIAKNISNSGAIGRGNSTVTIPDAYSNTAIIKGIPFPNNTTGNCNVVFNSNIFNDTTQNAMNCTKVGYNSTGVNSLNTTSVGSITSNGYTSGTTIGYGTGGGFYTTAIGSQATTGATNSTVIGYNAYTTTQNIVLFGNSAETVYIPGRLTTQTISTTTTPKLTVNNDAYVSGYVNTKGNVFINGTNTLYQNLTAMNSGGFIINATYDGNCVSGDPTGTGAGVFSISGMPQGISYRSVIGIYAPFYIYKVIASCKTVPTIQAGGPIIELFNANNSTILCPVTFTTGQTTATANFNTLFSTNNNHYVMFAQSASPGSGGTFWKATYFCRWF